MLDTPILRRFPENATVTLSDGTRAPVPYRVYDGESLVVAGTCELEAARRLCAEQSVEPITTGTGRGLLSLSFWDFREANLGAHTECQLTLLVSQSGTHVSVPDHPLAGLASQLTEDRCQLLIAQIFNNREKVVRYNREVFSLDARLCESSFEWADGGVELSVRDAVRDDEVVTYRAGRLSRSQPGTVFSMIRKVGLRRLLQSQRDPYAASLMVNRVTGDPELLQHNAHAMAYYKDQEFVLRWSCPEDVLNFGPAAGEMAKMGFEPSVLLKTSGIQFVYVRPHDFGDR